MKIKNKILIFSIIIGILFWALDSIIDTFFMESGNAFIDNLIFRISPNALYIRVLFLATLLVFGIINSKILEKRDNITESYRKSQEKLSITLNSIGDAVITTNEKGLIKRMNPIAEELTGFSSAEVRNKYVDDIFNIINEVNGEKVENPACETLKTGEKIKVNEDLGIIAKDGRRHSIAVSSAPIKDNDGVIIGVVLVFRDVSEERLAKKKLINSEQMLISSEEKFRKIFSLSPVAIVISHIEDGVIVETNKAFSNFIGYSTDELIGNSSIDLKIWKTKAPRNRLVEAVLEQGEVQEFELENITKSGEVRISSISATLIDIDNKKCLISYAKDITERRKAEESLRKIHEELEWRIKERTIELETINEELTKENIERSRAETALRQSEIKYRTLVNQIPIGVYRTTVDGKFLQANPAIAKILGYDSVDSLMNKSVFDFFLSSADRDALILKQKGAKSIVKEELELKRKDGKNIWVWDFGQVIQNDQNEVEFISGTLEDITARKEMQLALQESENRYSRLFENLHDIFFRITDKRYISLVSPSASKSFGYTIKELIGMSLDDLLLYPEASSNFLKQIKKTGRVNNFVTPIKTKEGSVVYFSINAHLYIDENRTVKGIEGIARDITSDIKYKNLLTSLYDISKAINSTDSLQELYSSIHNSLSNVIEAQNFYIALYDKERGMIRFPYVADQYYHDVPDVDINEPNLLTPRIIRTGDPFLLNINNKYEYETWLGNDDDEKKPVIWLGVPLRLKNEIIGAIVVQSYDNPDLYKEKDIPILQPIADQIAFAIVRKRAVLSLDFQIRFLQNLIDTIPNPVYYMDSDDKKYKGCNRAFEEITGYRQEEIIGKQVWDIFPKENASVYDKFDNDLLKYKGVQNFETQVTYADSSVHDCIFYKSCYRDNEGTVVGIVGIILDITDQKSAQDEIKIAREYAELIYKVTPSSIFTIDNERRITSWNERIASLTGFTSKDVIGKKCRLCRESIQNDHCQILSENHNMPIFGKECKIITKSGEQKIISKNMDVLMDSKGKIIGGIESFDDITGRKRIEEALYWQAGVNSAVAELSKAIMSIASLNEISALILEHAQKLTGSSTGFIGHLDKDNGHMKIAAITEDIQKKSRKNLYDETFREYNGSWGWVLRHKRALMINSPATDPKSYGSNLWDIPVNRFIGAPSISGNKQVGIMALANSDRDYTEQDLEIIERLASLFAIALQRIQAENEIRAALGKEQELNEMKSQFISMVSHEYRTPLTAIVLSTELLSEYDEQITKDDKLKYFDRIRRSVATMNTLLDDIISFNKVELGKVEFNPQYIDIEQLCTSIIHEMELMANEKCQLEMTIKNGNILANLDEKLIRKILVNLISNAIKYSLKGSTVEFRIECRPSEIEFIVKDRGIGMSQKTQDNLFEPFYRGRNVGNISGTGLGLAIVKNSVEMHNGTLEYTSEINVGTTFVITIPYSQQMKIPKKAFKK